MTVSPASIVDLLGENIGRFQWCEIKIVVLSIVRKTLGARSKRLLSGDMMI